MQHLVIILNSLAYNQPHFPRKNQIPDQSHGLTTFSSSVARLLRKPHTLVCLQILTLLTTLTGSPPCLALILILWLGLYPRSLSPAFSLHMRFLDDLIHPCASNLHLPSWLLIDLHHQCWSLSWFQIQLPCKLLQMLRLHVCRRSSWSPVHLHLTTSDDLFFSLYFLSQ